MRRSAALMHRYTHAHRLCGVRPSVAGRRPFAGSSDAGIAPARSSLSISPGSAHRSWTRAIDASTRESIERATPLAVGPLVQTPFLMMHATLGWCPPSLWFRPMRLRTRFEIQPEREEPIRAFGRNCSPDGLSIASGGKRFVAVNPLVAIADHDGGGDDVVDLVTPPILVPVHGLRSSLAVGRSHHHGALSGGWLPVELP